LVSQLFPSPDLAEQTLLEEGTEVSIIAEVAAYSFQEFWKRGKRRSYPPPHGQVDRIGFVKIEKTESPCLKKELDVNPWKDSRCSLLRLHHRMSLYRSD